MTEAVDTFKGSPVHHPSASNCKSRHRFVGALRGNGSPMKGHVGGGSASPLTIPLVTTQQYTHDKKYSARASCLRFANLRSRWSSMSRQQRIVWTIVASFLGLVALQQCVVNLRMTGAEHDKRRVLGPGGQWKDGKGKHSKGGNGTGKGDDDNGIGLLKARGIIPWDLANTGRDTSRDRLVQWWLDNPEAPVGLSCAMVENSSRGMDKTTNVKIGDHATDIAISTSNKRNLALGPDADDVSLVKHVIKSVEDTYHYRGFGIAPPIFKGRTPEPGNQSVQLAYVIPFVEFQINKVATLLSEKWSKFPPCHPDSPRESVDLVFFTENKLSSTVQRRIRSFYADLGFERTGCFRTDEPSFLSMAEVDPKLSHLEGAGFTFYSLFRLLEKDYKTFLLAEPDVAPIQPNFVPALVKKSQSVNCGADGFWQIGSIPLAKDVDAGMLQERLDYHMNGNGIYVLGCPEYEEYKCRVQSFYVPKDDCENVAGCSTHEAYEGGYDHAMYRFRMHPENYEYSRLILHKFAYSDFIQNRGEGVYDPADVVIQTPSTHFVHSKSIYQTAAATTLKEVTVSVLRRDPCHRDSPTEKVLEKIYQRLRSGEYEKADAIKDLCEASKYKIFGPHASPRLCDMYANDDAAIDEATRWKHSMPGKTYLWTMDFHGGPANCDMSMITKAGGAMHAEIDGICHFYGLCKDRLKVIKADNWKEFDPSEQQKRDFQLAYKDDPEFKRVDAFICHHPVANCELFLPFNRSIIVHATTRLEFGRHDEGIDWRLSSGYDRDVGKVKWLKWIKTMQALARDKRNIIAANNLYDRDYIKYFTGIEDVMLLPSWCGDSVGTTFCEGDWESSLPKGWLPTRPEVVIVPYRSNIDRSRYKQNIRDPSDHPIIKELSAVPKAVANGTEVKMIRELYSDANPLRMLKHPAIIILPYQISTIQLIELYRLNIPTFCPSLSLLKRWCREHDLMWEVHYGWPENLMNVKDIPNPNGHALMDKYSKEWEEIFDHWIPKSDFYQWEHITYFDSWEHFHRLYQSMVKKGELERISQKMAKANSALKEDLQEKWKDILQRVKR